MDEKKICYAPRGTEKRIVVSMTIEPLIKLQAMRAALEHGQTLSNFTEDALRAFLKQYPLDDREPNVG